MRGHRVVRLSTILALSLVFTSCAHYCVPPELTKGNDWVDLSATEQEHGHFDPGPSREMLAEVQSRKHGQHPPGARPYRMLALSGGGLFASYGAGILKGWTESGTRPEFDMVTGVSSGALMATFAFLGSDYDGLLKERLVGIEPREAIRRLPLYRMPLAGALFSTEPLTRGVYEAITPDILAQVARAHAAGRRLYIATTSLDARRLVIWDMGAIASRGDEQALALYQLVILASSAVPAALPPVIIRVEVNGKWYEEMHVDGAVSDGVVFRPNMVADLNRARGVPEGWAPPGSTLYVINNDKFFPEPYCVTGLLSALGATFEDLYSNKGRDGLARIYLNCLQTGVAFRVAGIAQDLKVAANSTSLSAADQVKLYEVGRQIGREGPTGNTWRDEPPGLEPSEQTVPRTGTRFATPPVCRP